MISAPQPEAAEAGADVLRAGGTIVDAAVTAALVQTVVDPQMCGIAGMGCLHLFLPGRGVHLTLDFHGRSPLATRPDMWADRIEREAEDGWGFILRGRENEFGYQAITTPRTLAALDHALRRWGTMSLAEAMRPAIGYAEQGCLVRPHVAEFWHRPPIAGRDGNIGIVTKLEAARKIYCGADGQPLRVGDTLRNPDMAATYRRIAEHGAEDFYGGAIARRIVADMQAHGGLLGEADLATCAPEETAPLWGTYRGLRIATNNPPGGGIMLIEMLNILENFDLAALGHNAPEYVRVVAEAMKIATADKDRSVGDPRFVDVPTERLTSKDYAARMAERIRRREKTPVPRFNSGGAESRHTTQLCLADSDGNALTMTHTLGQPSGVITDGLGFMYNGAMAVFDPRPGHAGSLEPGKSRFSALSPTIVFKEERPCLVLGAPGATYITMGNLQVMLNVIEFGMTAEAAVSAPRFAAVSDTIEVSNRILRSTERALVAEGYRVMRHAQSYTFAWVHAIRIGDDGTMDGGADPATGGLVVGV
ncbi:gamma-glutamyltransferase [Rhodopila sp.]|uniref:gamma-glutamyltransferase n=1 Tax=Rhodopila sp. TaxID=2480087 RepID=UPI002BAAE5D5|nr:gamma-glutamyltransferase [Rhodopila sp.]HVZ09582.1 gamma-glutamyltransferase [Rhodopila sp.]